MTRRQEGADNLSSKEEDRTARSSSWQADNKGEKPTSNDMKGSRRHDLEMKGRAVSMVTEDPLPPSHLLIKETILQKTWEKRFQRILNQGKRRKKKVKEVF